MFVFQISIPPGVDKLSIFRFFGPFTVPDRLPVKNSPAIRRLFGQGKRSSAAAYFQ
jgi:hypothetical protein